MTLQLLDAPVAFNFVVSQAYNINTTVYETKYPDLPWNELVFVDSSDPEWTPGTVQFVSNSVGAARWLAGGAKDVAKADVTRNIVTLPVHMAGIGYGYSLEEVSQASLMGMPLTTSKAAAARRAYNEFMWNITQLGDTAKGMRGLVNQVGVTTGTAPADGTGAVTTWFDANGVRTKTPAQILRDFNNVLIGIFTGSNTVEMADTVLLPFNVLAWLTSTTMTDTNSELLIDFIARSNMYTQRSGQPLTIRGVLGLDTAGAGSTRRMVAYANREDVVKLKLPMPHRFLPVYQDGPMHFEVPGIFRTGGVDVLRPSAFRYLDGI